MIRAICDLLQVRPADCIEYVEDRLGHDFRYAIDSGKIISQLNWTPKTSFQLGLEKTIGWYYERR